MTKKKRKKK